MLSSPLLSLPERQIMTRKTISDIAQEMAGIDIAILSTHTENGNRQSHYEQ